MKEYLRGILIFYRSFAPFAVLISVGSWVIFYMPLGRELMRFFPIYIFLKIFSSALIWYYIQTFTPHTLFFYFNLGISHRRLFLSAFALDTVLFLLFVCFLSVFF